MKKIQTSRLTNSQLLIWLGVEQNPDVPIYNMGAVFQIEKKLDEEAFERALQRVISESETMRSTFQTVAGAPVRNVLNDLQFRLHVADFSQAIDDTSAIEEFLTHKVQQKFQLDQRCFDTALVRLPNDCSIWFLVMHHLLCDAWSMKLIYERVERFYREEKGENLESLVIPEFSSFVDFEETELVSPHGLEAKTYWQEVVDDARTIAPTSIFGVGASKQKTATGSTRLVRTLGVERTAALMKATQDARFRSFNSDLALFQMLSTALAVLCLGKNDQSICIGTPAANRSGKNHRKIIGLLMEMYALRIDIAPGDTCIQVFEKVRIASMSFLRNAIPGTSSAELVQTGGVLLNFLPFSFPAFDGAPVSTRFLHSGASESHHLLRVQVGDFDGSGNLSIDFDFNDTVFTRHLMNVVADAYLRVIDAIVADPDKRIKEIDLLGEVQRKFLLDTLNNTDVEYEVEHPLHILFERQAHSSADTVAVMDGSTELTYRTLNDRANQLADRLKKSGIAKGDVIAILSAQGIDFLLAILAVLKVGGVYVPMDPDWPIRRLETVLKSLSSKILLKPGTLNLNWNSPGIEILSIESVEAGKANRSSSEIEAHGSLDDAAYILFTSGSTGTPRGVRCRHRSVLNLLLDIETRAPLSGPTNTSWWTSPGFDVSVYEIFSALAFGRTLYVTPNHVRGDAKQFYNWIKENNIASAYVPPFMLGDFDKYCREEVGPLPLERMLVGVEPIAESTLRNLLVSNPALKIINGYGPTETTICATLYSVPKGDSQSGRTPIGTPVRNTRCYVLDEDLNPVPFGAPGELCITGDGVALGYLNDLNSTSKKFIADPFDPQNYACMYRTGDRVRYLGDGNLEFLGRMDAQIKMRGYRIEPVEIEEAICSYSEVSNAVVVSCDIEGEQKLVAYVAGNGAADIATDEWFTRLSMVLPRYMVPTVFISLPSFPLNTSGKIDRSALPSPSVDKRTDQNQYRPRSESGKILLKIWEEALGTKVIGQDEHFIDLGGDSMKALQISTLLHESGIAVTPKQIFESPTLSLLEALIHEVA